MQCTETNCFICKKKIQKKKINVLVSDDSINDVEKRVMCDVCYLEYMV